MAVEVVFEHHDDVYLPLFRPVADRTGVAGDEPPPRSRSSGGPSSRASASRRSGRRLGRTDLDLTVDACLAAVADAGLTRDDIDGLATYPGMGAGTAGFAGPTTPEVQDALRLRLNWHDGGGEGPGQMRALIAACLAVGAGLARHVLVYRTVTESTAQGTGGPPGHRWRRWRWRWRPAVLRASCSGRSPSGRCPPSTGSPWWPSAGCTSSG